jgi:NIPSNAP
VLYWHEINRVRPQKMSGLLEAVERELLPLAESYGMRQVGYWQVAPGLGTTPETIAVWELDDFGHYVEVIRQRFEGKNADLGQWFDGVGEWVDSSESLLCFPSALTPTVAQIKESGLAAKMCSHEMIQVQPARQAEYLRLCEEMWFRRVAEPAGRSIVGLYWSPWKNTKAICIWGQGEEWDLVNPFGKEEAWVADPDFEIWQTLGREIRTDWDDRFLVPVSFSTVH